MVRLKCSVQLAYQAKERCTFILNVQPAAIAQQDIVCESLIIPAAAEGIEHFRSVEGNRFVRFTAAGDVFVKSQFTVDLHHRLDRPEELLEMSPAELPSSVLTCILPSRYCQSDHLMPMALKLFGHQRPGYQRVVAVAEWVRELVQFKPGTTRTETSASDVLRQREGVCRDFAHLMIAMLRALNIPSRFATGIDYGADPSLGPVDFHAYVEVFLSGRWYLFDPTGISPTTGLVRIGTGRDAADVSFATIFGDVTSAPPVVTVEALQDEGADIFLPERTSDPVSMTTYDDSIAQAA